MMNLTPSMRLKVKRDTFFSPDLKGGMYFRNNLCSFHMEGSMIEQWVKQLMPMFNGEYTIGELTKGLPEAYRNRVYEIADTLYQNGFIGDVSQDQSHQLTNQILKKYASQIEFLDSFGSSGAHRFQTYRQVEVLIVGCGPFFVSAVSALIESGLPKFHVLITESIPTNKARLLELATHACKTDPEVAIEEVLLQNKAENSWRKVIEPFQTILYVSQQGHIEELRALHQACREEKKMFIPAICLEQVGMAGPVVCPESEHCWESAWRRIHQSAFSKKQIFSAFSSTASAMLANIIVFELFKKVTGVTESKQNNQFYLLDLDTLEGNWHSFQSHPLVTGRKSVERVQDLALYLEQNEGRSELHELLLYFDKLTSKQSGIFHTWAEGELKQLPLAQCRVQPVNPLVEGPAELLPEIVCTALTHEEARKEAGLAGIEAYMSQAAEWIVVNSNQEINRDTIAPQECIGIGAGETTVEAVYRGLQKCLMEEWSKQQEHQKNVIARIQLEAIEDERCQFYLQTLTTMQGGPVVGLGESVCGFPVVWVGTETGWYSSVDLNITRALRRTLQQVIIGIQHPAVQLKAVNDSSVLLDKKEPQKFVIQSCEETVQLESLQSAIQTLKNNKKRIIAFEIEWEPLLKEESVAVLGVLLREEEVQ